MKDRGHAERGIVTDQCATQVTAKPVGMTMGDVMVIHQVSVLVCVLSPPSTWQNTKVEQDCNALSRDCLPRTFSSDNLNAMIC